MRVIAFASVKGGVGKTAGVVFAAGALSSLGKRVVVIDADPNNCATDYFLRDSALSAIAEHSLYRALSEGKSLADCVMDVDCAVAKEHIRIIPATPQLARVGVELSHDPGVVMRFPKAVQALHADIVVIDTPPALTLELSLALYAADVVVVPVGANRWTIGAYSVIADMVSAVSDATGRPTSLFALPAIVTPRESERLRKIGSWTVTNTSIPKSSAARSALNAGRALSNASAVWTSYRELSKELLG